MAIEVRSMPFNYQLQKEGKDFSLFQDSEYPELNLTDIELFCEDYLCNDFKDQTHEDEIFRMYLTWFLCSEEKKVLEKVAADWKQEQIAYPGIVALYSHNMVTAKKGMQISAGGRSRVRSLLNKYIGKENELLMLPRKYQILKNKVTEGSLQLVKKGS